jgi:Tol biopolymer transport system component
MFTVSESGALAYSAGGSLLGATGSLVWVDRQGKEQAIPAPARTYNQNARLSPDGGRAALQLLDLQQGFRADLWVYDVERTTLTRLTSEGNNINAVWTPDGKRVIHLHSPQGGGGGSGVRSVPADNSGPAATIAAMEAANLIPASISPDGKVLLGIRAGDIWALDLGDPQAKPRKFLESQFAELDPRFSPDGRWVAYSANDSGSEEIYVAPYPGPGGRTPVSTAGGARPNWNRNGRELFYREGAKLMAVEVQIGATFRAGTPKALFEGAQYAQGYDVSPDGGRFLFVKPNAGGPDQELEVRVVLNWAEELRRRAPLR